MYENKINEKSVLNTLYENVEERFLNLNSIREMIGTLSEENIDIVETKEYTTYTYMLENTKMEIVTDVKKITKITIKNNSDIYVLAFN